MLNPSKIMMCSGKIRYEETQGLRSVWVGLGSAWGRFGIGLVSVWDRFGIGLGSVLGQFWVGLGSV